MSPDNEVIETDEVSPDTSSSVEEDSQEILSVSNFRLKPFKEKLWEVVGERIDYGGFQNLEAPVVDTREELVDSMFENFGKQISDGQEVLYHSVNPIKADDSDKDSSNEIDESLIQDKLKEADEKGRLEGIEEGIQQAQAKILEQYETLSLTLVGITDSVRTEAKQLFNTLEQEALKLSLNVSRKILSSTADIKVDYIEAVIKEGLSKLGAGKPLRIRVAPKDMEFIEIVGLPVELSKEELGVTYIADESIQSGCIIETDFGDVNLELDRMWEEIASELYEVCKK